MTKDTDTDTDTARTDSEGRKALRFFLFLAACIGGLFFIAFTAGFVAGMAEDRSASWRDAVALGIAFAMLCGLAWVLRKTVPDMALPSSPRMRANRRILYVTLVLGVLLGIALALVGDLSGASVSDILSAEGPIPQPVALLLIAGLALVTALSIRWHMLLDEHERAAYDFGGIAALYGYFILSAGWWLAWRGGMVPAPDGYAIFWTTMIVWGAGWLARRFF